MWWNISIGASMLLSSFSSFLGNMFNIGRSSKSSSNSSSNGGNSNYIPVDTVRETFRVSKYPSKTTMGFY